MQQQTEAWFEARLGKVTASRVSAVLMKPTTKGFQDYQAELVTERLNNQPMPHFTSPDMEWGVQTEPQARAAYELETGHDVEEVGFIDHHLIPMSGASPDGVVGKLTDKSFGLVEIKCPRTHTHIKNLISETPDKVYIDQMQWQMACTGADWCDFVSFDPRVPYEVQMAIVRIEREDVRILEMENAVRDFLTSTEELFEKITSKMKEAA